MGHARPQLSPCGKTVLRPVGPVRIRLRATAFYTKAFYTKAFYAIAVYVVARPAPRWA